MPNLSPPSWRIGLGSDRISPALPCHCCETLQATTGRRQMAGTTSATTTTTTTTTSTTITTITNSATTTKQRPNEFHTESDRTGSPNNPLLGIQWGSIQQL